MLAGYNERIEVQHVSNLFEVQEKMRVWMSRSIWNGFKEEASSENQAMLKRRSMQGYYAAAITPIFGFFYGTIMYGAFAGLIHAAFFGVCGLCSIPLAKPTIITTTWNNESPYQVYIDATGEKRDYKKAIEDLKYILSTDPGTTDPGTSIQ